MTLYLLAALAWAASLAPVDQPKASPTAAPAQIVLRAGETVQMTIDEGGQAAETARGSAPAMSRFEAAAAWHLTNGAYRDASGPNSAAVVPGELGIPEPPPVEDGQVSIKLFALGDAGTLLILENGYRGALQYRATIDTGGRSERTDVCQVLPSLYSFEHWPYAIERIALSDLRLVPWFEGQRPVCE